MPTLRVSSKERGREFEALAYPTAAVVARQEELRNEKPRLLLLGPTRVPNKVENPWRAGC